MNGRIFAEDVASISRPNTAFATVLLEQRRALEPEQWPESRSTSGGAPSPRGASAGWAGAGGDAAAFQADGPGRSHTPTPEQGPGWSEDPRLAFGQATVLDLSRLILGCRRSTPSGIDRVEMAYARHVLCRESEPGLAVAQSLWGWFAAIPLPVATRFIEALRRGWAGDADALGRARKIAAALHFGLALGQGRAALRARLNTRSPAVFLLVSHRALDRERPIANLLKQGARLVPMLHDLIPLTHPEYTRPPQIGRHARRVASIARHASAVIVNSAATAAALSPRLADAGAAPAVLVAPLGLAATVRRTRCVASAPATFIALGTIEPRKNHLLLLHLWRDFAERLGRDAPRLVLIGRRGWENENIVDILDRGTALRGLVEEAGALSDAAVADRFSGATALLFPSFAEGYGLPLAEALAAGVPAICSDLPALREVGGQVPDYLDPLDGLGWRAAILDHARPDSPMRSAQLARLSAWRPPEWPTHFAAVADLIRHVRGTRAAAEGATA